MKFLVDANVLSEPTKASVVQRVVDWLDLNATECVTDAVVMGEIWTGVDALPEGRKRTELELWFRRVRGTVRCLDWTIETAVAWGTLFNNVKRSGFDVGLKDTMIAATAKQHNLIVATRNVDDFTRCGVQVINPFE